MIIACLTTIVPTRLRSQKFWVLVILISAVSAETLATHIRAAQIHYRRITATAFTYEFTLMGYTDIQAPVRFGDGIIDFGDGRAVQIDLEASSFEDGQFLGPNDEIEVYTIKIVHTYNAPGQYRVSYREPNRNDEVVNINNGNSVQVPFHVEASLWVDPVIGLNNSPVLTSFPIDRGVVGQRFSHNPWAYDAEGDSLVYRLLVPLQDKDQLVPNYHRPNDRDFYMDPLDYSQANERQNGPPIFEINYLTGDLVWDAPGNLLQNTRSPTSSFGPFSEYNVAFIVEEWRKIEGSWRRLGHVTRDMQIIITGQPNQRPDFELPPDLIITSSQPVQQNITFSDPDGDPIKVEFFGEVFDLPNNPMTITPVPGDFTNGPLSLNLEWTPLPEHVRDRPYLVHLKITDNPDDPSHNPAVTYKTWVLSFTELPDVITALPEEQGETKFQLYPNPTRGRLAWRLDENDPEVRDLAIYNSLGQRTIFMELSSTGIREVDVGRLSPGIYYAVLAADGIIYRRQFVKE